MSPMAAQKPCGQPGCATLVHRGQRFCDQHKRATYRYQNRVRREDSERRAIDANHNSPRWRKYRAWKLRQDPLCAECQRQGRTSIAVIVDHIAPVAAGGDFWDPNNTQSLCDTCHRKKSARETFGHARG